MAMPMVMPGSAKGVAKDKERTSGGPRGVCPPPFAMAVVPPEVTSAKEVAKDKEQTSGAPTWPHGVCPPPLLRQ